MNAGRFEAMLQVRNGDLSLTDDERLKVLSTPRKIIGMAMMGSDFASLEVEESA